MNFALYGVRGIMQIQLEYYLLLADPANIRGQIFTIFVITVAAAEAAVGLAIILTIYRNRDTIDMEQFNLLKW